MLYIIIILIITAYIIYINYPFFIWKIAISNDRFIKNRKLSLENYNIPKKIWMFWDKGFDKSPSICKLCVQSWKYHNPEWEINILDNNTIYDYLDPILINKFKIQLSKNIIDIAGFSDFIRICLLTEYGGVWADITTFCNKPLNSWINQVMELGFFTPMYLFRIPFVPSYISNWLIISTKHSPLCLKVKNEYINFILHSTKKVPYFSFHFCVQKLISNDMSFKNIWGKIPFINTRYPHLFFWYRYHNDWKSDIDEKITPLYKLTYKVKNDVMKDPFVLYLSQSIT